MKKFLTKEDYISNRHEGVCFLTVSKSDCSKIKSELESLHRQIVENSRIAADYASKVILNR